MDCRSEVCIWFILSINGGVVKRMLGSYTEEIEIFIRGFLFGVL